MQSRKIKLKCPNDAKILILGTDKNARHIFNALSHSKKQILGFIDNKSISFQDLPVISIEDAINCYRNEKNILILNTSTSHSKSILEQHFSHIFDLKYFALFIEICLIPCVNEKAKIEFERIFPDGFNISDQPETVPISNQTMLYFLVVMLSQLTVHTNRRIANKLAKCPLYNKEFLNTLYQHLLYLGDPHLKSDVFACLYLDLVEKEEQFLGELYIKSLADLMNYHNHLGKTQTVKTIAKEIIDHFSSFKSKFPENYSVHKLAAIASQEINGIEHAVSILCDANDKRRKQTPNQNTLFLTPSLFKRIGSSLHAETLIKTNILHFNNKQKFVCLYNEESWGNPHLIKKYLNKFINFIPHHEAPDEYLETNELHDSYFELAIQTLDGTRFLPPAAIAVRKQWQDAQKEPLFKLSSDDKALGDTLLKRMGLNPNSPIVTIHIRNEKNKNTSFRDSSTENFIKGIEWLCKQGVIVVRLGNSSMPPLPTGLNVIDCVSDPKPDWFDIYCIAQSAFFIGSGSSGPITVPTIFGVPTLSLNTLPIGAACGTNIDTFIPNLCLDKRTHKVLPFSKVLSIDASVSHFSYQWEELDMTPIPNTEEDILEAIQYKACKTNIVTKEAYAHLFQERENVSKEFSKLLNFPSTMMTEKINSQIPVFFMNKYQHLL